jgi:hypothetical protein
LPEVVAYTARDNLRSRDAHLEEDDLPEDVDDSERSLGVSGQRGFDLGRLVRGARVEPVADSPEA